MADGYYKDIVKQLKAYGFAYKENAKGSHEKWVSVETGKIVIVPRNLKSRHTANSILKDIGSSTRF